MNDWQPIETAPRDGSKVLVFQPAGQWKSRRSNRGQVIEVCYWHHPANPEYDGIWVPACRPTHWMLLPDPPSSPKQEEVA